MSIFFGFFKFFLQFLVLFNELDLLGVFPGVFSIFGVHERLLRRKGMTLRTTF